jgi:hypothetical protein
MSTETNLSLTTNPTYSKQAPALEEQGAGMHKSMFRLARAAAEISDSAKIPTYYVL